MGTAGWFKGRCRGHQGPPAGSWRELGGGKARGRARPSRGGLPGKKSAVHWEGPREPSETFQEQASQPVWGRTQAAGRGVQGGAAVVEPETGAR